MIFFTYYYSKDKDKTAGIDKNISTEGVSKLEKETSNIIENVNYIGASGGTSFELNAAVAEVKNDKPNISLLQEVFAVIKMSNLR